MDFFLRMYFVFAPCTVIGVMSVHSDADVHRALYSSHMMAWALRLT